MHLRRPFRAAGQSPGATGSGTAVTGTCPVATSRHSTWYGAAPCSPSGSLNRAPSADSRAARVFRCIPSATAVAPARQLCASQVASSREASPD